MKHCRQVWNSLGNYFLCRAWHFIKKSWKSVHPFFHNITNKHGSRKKKNRPRIQGLDHNIPKMFQIVLFMCVLCWKFHEITFSRFSVMLLTNRQTDKQTNLQWRKYNRSPVNAPHKGHWRETLWVFFICDWTNSWVNNRDASDLRRHRDYYNITVMPGNRTLHGGSFAHVTSLSYAFRRRRRARKRMWNVRTWSANCWTFWR